MTIFVLPGMGASSEMYQGPWRSLENSTFIDWPPYGGEHSLAAIAQRAIDEYHIESGAVVVGTSLGGMVAQEIATLVNVEHVFLIGSAVSRDEINPFLKALAPLSAVTPIKLAQLLAGVSGDVGQMFQQADPLFIRAMCIAISKWNGSTTPPETMTRIHGEKDEVIHCSTEALIVKDAGHLVAVSHPEECVQLVWTTLTCI